MYDLSDFIATSPTTILLDSDVLLLYLMGRVDRKRISEFPRTAHYTEAEFEVLERVVTSYPTVGVTPSVLTEASNLTKRGSRKLKKDLRRELRKLVSSLEENYVPSTEATANPNFVRLGLADVGLIEAAKTYAGRAVIITDDGGLHRSATQSNIQSVNFTYLVQRRMFDGG